MVIKYDNTPAPKWELGLVVSCIILCTGGAISFLISGFYFGAIVMILIGSFATIGMSYRPIISRPKAISFNGEGITLYLPSGKQKTVRWDRLTNIHADEGDHSTLKGRIIRSGSIRENKNPPIDLSYELAMVVKDEYWNRFGDSVYKIFSHSRR